MMLMLPGWMETSPGAYVANTERFWGLGKTGLAVTIIISVILIVTVAWIINGTKKRD